MGELYKQKEKKVFEIKAPVEEGKIQRTKSFPVAPPKQEQKSAPKQAPVKLPPAQAKLAAPGNALIQVKAPAMKLEGNVVKKAATFNLAQRKKNKGKPQAEENGAALRLMELMANRALEEINPEKKISGFSMHRRKNMYFRKKDCRERAQEIARSINYAEQLKAKKTMTRNSLSVNPVNFAAGLKRMVDCSINFMRFKDDENFLKHYDESMNELGDYAAYAPILMKMDQKKIDKLNKAYHHNLPKISVLRQKAAAYTYCREWYAAKLNLMSNQHYLYLKDTDTAALKQEDIQEKERTLRAAGKTELAKYMKAVLQMKKAESLGAVHTADDRLKWRGWGNSGRTAHKWGVELFSAKGSLKYPPKKIFTDKKELQKFILDLDVDTKYMLLAKFQLKEKDVQEGKSQKWIMLEAKDVWDTLVEIKKDLIKTNVKLKTLKGRYKYKKSVFSFGANASVGAVSAKGNIGAGLSLGKNFYGKAQIAGSASATALQSRVKVGLNWQNFGINLKGQGKLATASAEGFVGAGKMKFRDYDGNKYEATGIGGMATAQASLVEAEASGGITIFGIKIGASLAFQAGGVGGTIGGFANASGIGASFGALFGLGFRLNISINWSGFLKWRKDRKEKKKLKEKQLEEMKARTKQATGKKKTKAKAGPAGGNKGPNIVPGGPQPAPAP